MFTTSAIFTCDTAPADAFAAAPSSARRVPRLPHDAVAARRIDRPQDRADVVRILDAVEHDDQRRRLRADHQILDAVARRVRDVGDHALVPLPPRQPIELVAADPLDRARPAPRPAARARVSRSSARGDDPKHASRASPRSASRTGLMP